MGIIDHQPAIVLFVVLPAGFPPVAHYRRPCYMPSVTTICCPGQGEASDRAK
ncbi:hypothetical protein ACVXHB_12625 [Escherichia coli]